MDRDEIALNFMQLHVRREGVVLDCGESTARAAFEYADAYLAARKDDDRRIPGR